MEQLVLRQFFQTLPAEYDEEAPQTAGYYRNSYQPIAQDQHKLPLVHARQLIPPSTHMGVGGSAASRYQQLQQSQNYPQQQQAQRRRPVPLNKLYWEEREGGVSYSDEDERMVSKTFASSVFFIWAENTLKPRVVNLLQINSCFVVGDCAFQLIHF